MTRFRLSVCLAALVAAAGFSELATAGGSSGGSLGGYASAGGSSTGGSSGGIARYRAGSSGGSYGSSGGYASSGGSSGGYVGPLRRLAARIQANRAARLSAASSGGSYGSSGGSSGGISAGSSGGSSGGAVVAYRSAGSSGGSSGSVRYSTPVTSYSVPLSHYGRSTSARPAVASIARSSAISGYESSSIQSSYRKYESARKSVAAAKPEAKTPESDRYQVSKPALDDDAALLTVAVPSEKASVTVNGHETSSDGMVRKFMSRGLKDGYLYTYVVKVTYDHEGETKTESREVKLRPGDNERVVFEPPANAKPQAEDMSQTVSTPEQSMVTVVKLHVPADAVVNLAGNDTSGEGEVRTFRTTQLKPGDRWSNYTVRVTAKVNGQNISRERTIDVVAGSTNELKFDFDQSTVAQR